MADYRIQVTATKATWIEDKAYYELTARVVTRRKGIAIPAGQFVIFDPGDHRKQIDARGNAFLRLSTNKPGMFTTMAILESDDEVWDEVDVVVPEKPKGKIPEEIEAEKVEAQLREHVAKGKIRKEEAEARIGHLKTELEEKRLNLELSQFDNAARQKAELEIKQAELEIAKLEKQIAEARKEPAAKKLAKPCVRAEGDEGVYVISAAATHEDGTLAKKAVIRLLISKLGKPAVIEDMVTDENGLASFVLEFTEAECDVTWQCACYEGEIQNLYGPTPSKIKRVEIPEPTEHDLQGGLFSLIGSAWRGGAKSEAGKQKQHAKTDEDVIDLINKGDKWTL